MSEVYKAEQHRYAKEERWLDFVVRYEADTPEGVLALEALDQAKAKANKSGTVNIGGAVTASIASVESVIRLHDESRSLVWNIPNAKGETVERRLIPAGSWMNYRDGIRVRMPGAVCDVLLPLSEAEYHDGQPLAPIRRDGVDYPPNADTPLIVGS